VGQKGEVQPRPCSHQENAHTGFPVHLAERDTSWSAQRGRYERIVERRVGAVAKTIPGSRVQNRASQGGSELGARTASSVGAAMLNAALTTYSTNRREAPKVLATPPVALGGADTLGSDSSKESG
jgi:hypothetical protein